MPVGDICKFRDRLNCSNHVIGRHDQYQASFGRQCPAKSFRIDEPVFIDGQ